MDVTVDPSIVMPGTVLPGGLAVCWKLFMFY